MPSLISRRLLLPVLAMLAGCAGPTVRLAAVPAVSPPAAWRTDAACAGAIDPRWWQAFGDPALTALVERAVADNTDIAIAVARVREARANQALARSQLLPTLGAGLAAGRLRDVSAFGTPEVQSFAQPQLEAGYEVDLFGRLNDNVSAARSSYLASAAARDAVQLAVAGATAGQYIALLGLEARLAVARQTLAARAESLRIATSRDRAGYATKLGLRQSQAEYAATAQIIPPIEIAIARSENALSQLVGSVPGPISRGKQLDDLVAPVVPAGLPSELLDRRPDIAQAANQLAASDASLAAARKRFLPQIRLSATAGVAFSTLVGNPITIWSAGGSVLAPLFQGGRLTAQANVAAAQRDQAAQGYRRTVLTSFHEVEDALANVSHLDEQLVLARRQRDALAAALRLATNRYREGYSPYLEQLDAQRGLLTVELEVVRLATDVLNARVQLYQAMGGGWSNSVQPCDLDMHDPCK